MLGATERRSAERLLEAALATGYMDHHVAYSTGAAFAQLGEHRRAVEWLRKAADTGFPCDVWFSRDPLLDPLRGNDGFRQLMTDLAARRQAAASRYAAPITSAALFTDHVDRARHRVGHALARELLSCDVVLAPHVASRSPPLSAGASRQGANPA